MKDVMLDLETLGTRYDAMIISIGAVYFDRITGQLGDEFSVNTYPGEHADKFTVDYGTISWWLGQSENARARAVDNPVPIEIALKRLTSFLNRGIVGTVMLNDTVLWSHATFDMPILMNAYDTLGQLFSVPFRNIRDLRTLMDLADHRSTTLRAGTHHHALDDAKFQAAYASEAMRKLHGESI